MNRVITPGTYTIVDSAEPIVGFNSLGTVGVQFNANTPDTGQFLAAGSGPDYRNSVFTNFFATPELANANTNLVMDVDYAFASLPGLTPSESALGAALDTLALRAGTGTLGLAEQDLISALALSDLGSVQASLAGLSPESSVALVASVINSNYRVNAELDAFRPYASVAYAHEFKDDANFATARFGGVPFQVSAPQLGSSVIVTAGTGYAFTQNLMMNIGYRGDISLEDSGITSHGATLGLSYSF